MKKILLSSLLLAPHMETHTRPPATCMDPRAGLRGLLRRVLRYVTLAFVACLPLAAQAAVGDPAPRLAAARWYNHIGEPLSSASVKGRAVLVNFFVTEKPEKAQFRILRKLHQEYGQKGLLIIALTADSSSAVEGLLREWDLPFVIGAGSNVLADWGVRGKYAQVLIEPGGTVYWRADAAAAVWDGKLLKAMRGAERLGARAALRFTPVGEFGGRLAKLVVKLRAGELAKALKELERIAGNARGAETERSAARDLVRQTLDHAESVVRLSEQHIERREVLPARAALEVLAKDMRGRAPGTRARELLARFEDDEVLALEVEAAEEYVRLTQLYWRIGPSKTAPRFENLVERWPDSRAAQKARAILLHR